MVLLVWKIYFKRCINRLENIKGHIKVDGVELNDDVKKIDKIRSEVGMVFQSFNLFPHLTALENCTLAPVWVRKLPKKDADEIAMKYLEIVKIPEQALKYPGVTFRWATAKVAIARALKGTKNNALMSLLLLLILK